MALRRQYALLKRYAPRFMSPFRTFMTPASDGTNLSEKVIDFSPKKVVLLKKISRYECEKTVGYSENDEQFEKRLAQRGSDIKSLLTRHEEYMRRVDDITEILSKRGLEVRVVNRFQYKEDDVNWADMIFTAGGDGTFLLAASRVKDKSKPVIGINTDPARSEGYLCLPKQYSVDFGSALDRILSNQFKWMWRQRIRLTTSGMHSSKDHIDLHYQQLQFPELRSFEEVKEMYSQDAPCDCEESRPPRILPFLSLNEVYIGESLSARVSYYELSIDGRPKLKEKSSGMTVCTGTGSTSWYFNINYICNESVYQIFDIAHKFSGSKGEIYDKNTLDKVTDKFNNSLRFDPTELKMAYTVRDPVGRGIYQVHNTRGFCNKMTIKSRMFDGWIVIDGSYSFHFNDGALVDIEMHSEDALRCVDLD